MGSTKESREKRSYKRVNYTGHILISTKNGFFQGELKNYSTSGLFIKTDEDLTLGDLITVAPPYMEDDQIKMQAKVLWRNSEGYGVEFVEKHS